MGIMPMFDKGAILNPVAAFQKQLELAFTLSFATKMCAAL